MTSGLLIYGKTSVADTYHIFCVPLSHKLLHFCLLWMTLTHLLLMSALNYFLLSPLFNRGYNHTFCSANTALKLLFLTATVIINNKNK